MLTVKTKHVYYFKLYSIQINLILEKKHTNNTNKILQLHKRSGDYFICHINVLLPRKVKAKL